MAGYIFLVLTLLFYISLIFFKPDAGQNDVIGGTLLFAFYGIGFISSAMLTIKVVQQGGFDWVSDQSNLRNAIVGMGWICMTMATLICLDLEAALRPSELHNFFQWLAKSKSLIWLPLLMLVPYFILLSTDLRASVSPNVYKIPLMLGFVVSTVMVMVLLFLGLKKKEIKLDDAKLSYEQAIAKIDVMDQLGYYWRFWDFTAPQMDERVRQYALKKIKEDEDWETHMKGCLADDGKRLGVYTYLDGNNLEHPKQFIEPINNSIKIIADEIGLVIQGSFRDESYLQYHLNVELLCRILEAHFKDSSAVFRPNMLEVQKALDTEPLDRYVDIRNKYRLAVKNWLATNK